MRSLLRVTALPVEVETTRTEAEPETVANLVRDRLGQFLGGVRSADPAVIATVSVDPGDVPIIGLELDRADLLGSMLAGLVDLAAEPAPSSESTAGRGWRLCPNPGPASGPAVHAWPSSGLRWPDILDALERIGERCAVQVALTPVAPPHTALAPLRRAARRRDDARAGAWQAPLDELAAAEVAFHVDIRVVASRIRIAELLAAAANGGSGVVVRETTGPQPPGGVLGLIRAGELVSPERAAGLLPLPALPMGSVSRHRRRSAVVDVYTPDTAGVELGTAAHGGRYALTLEGLNRHLLVTGLPGFGKSTTVRTLLTRLWRDHGIPFLVIDPEKTEYFALTEAIPHAYRVHLGTGDTQINPMAVPAGVNPASFADVIAECLDTATGLTASWPFAAAVLRNAITDLYHDDAAPTVAQLYRAVLTQAATYGGGGDQAANVRASLTQRVASIVAGAGGNSLAGGQGAGIDWARLTARPTVVSLAELGDQTTRQLVFGLLLAGLVAYRRAHPLPRFGHLAVLEEAHLLIGGTSGGHDHGAGASAAAATAAAIATQRGYGQGYVLVTQSPRQLPATVTRLFPNRISHRLAEAPEAGLLERVAEQLTMLGTGESYVVDAGGHPLPVWVKVEPEPLGTSATDDRDTISLLGESAADRIWCTACPAPCTGRHWLNLSAAAETAVRSAASGGASLPDQAVAAVMAARSAAARAGMTARNLAEVHTGTYCVIARALTSVHAAEPRDARTAVPIARATADRVVDETARDPRRHNPTKDPTGSDL